MIKKIFNKLFEKKEESPNFKVEVSFSTSNKEYKKKEYPKELLMRGLKEIGEVNAICPYCKKELEKKPGRKKKCPNCNNFIYVRTRPIDNIQILVKESEFDLVEKEWQKYYENKEDIDLSDNPLYVKIKESLRKQFGFEPKLSDVKWGYYNALKLEHIKKENWGMYRNTILDMAMQLKKESKNKMALQMLYEVMWYDIQGIQNVPMELRNEFPRFEKRISFIAPAVVSYIKELLEIVKEDKKELYEDWISQVVSFKDAPLTNEQVWKRIEKEVLENDK